MRFGMANRQHPQNPRFFPHFRYIIAYFRAAWKALRKDNPDFCGLTTGTQSKFVKRY
jgi:hypothetical protein